MSSTKYKRICLSKEKGEVFQCSFEVKKDFLDFTFITENIPPETAKQLLTKVRDMVEHEIKEHPDWPIFKSEGSQPIFNPGEI